MTPSDRIEGPARMSGLAAFIDHIDRFCAREGLPHAATLRLQVLFEELFTNTVAHGHGGDSDAPVTLTLLRAGDAVELCYEDSAPRFDPLAAGRKAASQRDGRLRRLAVGGVGLSLVLQMCSASSYAWRDGRNCVRLRLDSAPGPDATGATGATGARGPG